ncbi:MAG TPA: xanthine dehydrogenase family protein molybdopterin-binding subunit, partial [Stellaceae bacterium]|nr:xanthine dehydrogenase family protein molybdopterin-binding subunit [Stellaceae bacterium]
MNDVIELPDSTSLGAIGQPLRRKEDERLLTGRGRFSDDFTVPGQTYAAVVRSPHPHARIVEIDTRRALAMPGVLGILTGQDCAADGLSPIPHNPVPQTRYDMKLTGPGGGPIFIGPQMLLPSDRVRHVGEAVAVVVAETALQAQDAAEEVAVDYRELPWIAQIKGALTPGATAVWDEVPDNVLVDTFFGDAAATERAFAIADHIIEMEFHVGRVTGVPMEPRAALGHWDTATGRGTLWAGSGGAVRQKTELAEVLGVPPDRVRVVSLDVGGNFGTRNRLYVESGLVLWASHKLGRPVKYTSTRSEVFLTDFQGRDLLTRVALAIRADGKFLGLRADNVSNVGARCASLSPLGKGSALVTGSYDIPAATLRSRAVFTNTMPTNAYRSSGRPEVTYAIERVVDEAARRLGIDRVALRRMNLVDQEAMPYPNAVGARYDSGTYEANMDLAMEIADWDGFMARRRAAEARGKLLGLGLANYVESSIGAPRERSEITITSEGRVKVVIGTGPSGQGHETSFGQVVGAVLMVPVEAIDVVTGDTDIVSLGGGSHSGRSMRHSATLFAKAAPELIANGKRVAARLLDASVEEVTFADGRFSA